MKTTVDPELQRRLDKVKEDFEREKTETEPYRDLIKGYPTFVFEFDNYTGRKDGDDERILNTFGHVGFGVIQRQLGETAYLVTVNDTPLVVHEPRMAWVNR